jgi:hypothetical protein
VNVIDNKTTSNENSVFCHGFFFFFLLSSLPLSFSALPILYVSPTCKYNWSISRNILSSHNFHLPKEDGENTFEKDLEPKVDELFDIGDENVNDKDQTNRSNVPWR